MNREKIINDDIQVIVNNSKVQNIQFRRRRV